MVLVIALEVLGEVRDPLGEERDLDLGRAGVGLVLPVLRDRLGLAYGGNGHGWAPVAGGRAPWNGTRSAVVRRLGETSPSVKRRNRVPGAAGRHRRAQGTPD